MTRTVTALTAAAVIGLATTAAPRPASAIAEWVIPAIIVAGIGGVAVGTATTAYGPRGEVYVQPAPTTCRTIRERTPEGWRRVRVCD